jgi:AAA+ ATPase superfamily predicted ATPase
MTISFVDRERELDRLQRFWQSGRAECVPITGRRRVGKTFLAEQFAAGKRHVYFRCRLAPTSEQLPALGSALAALTDDAVVRAEPPTTWSGVLALFSRLAAEKKLLVILDELPYWAARDPSVPSTLQNWWDADGRHLNLLLIMCGSAVPVMERLFSGDAPLAGCVTGRLPVGPFDFRAAAQLLAFADPVDTLTAYGILGGVPLYLALFDAALSIEQNIATHIADTSARLYVEPDAVFAAHHQSYDRLQALAVLRSIADGAHEYSRIQQRSGVPTGSFARVLEPLIGDLGLVRRVLPVTETKQTRTYHTQYHLTDNFFRFWFAFIEPNTGTIEFGGGGRLASSIVPRLPDFLGLPFEELCREWVSLALGAGALDCPVTKVGTWWTADHQVDVVGLDAAGKVALGGEAKWRNQHFGWHDLETYLTHIRAMGDLVRPDVQHVLFSKSGFDPRVRDWAATTRSHLLTPAELLGPFPRRRSQLVGA